MKTLKDLTFKPISFIKGWRQTDYGPLAEIDYKLKNEHLVPGAVLKMKDGAVCLVGHCNPLMGVCDDCTDYHYEDIVAIAHIQEFGIYP